MILTVTPNPMLDKTLWVSAFTRGNTHRALRLETIVGGKGINAARALRFLKENAVATGFVGGRTGEAILEALKQEGLQHDFVTINSTTREGFTIIDAQTGQRTAVFEPGHLLAQNDIANLTEKVVDYLPYCQALALCGSMPCTGFDDFFAHLIEAARQYGVPVMLDTYGEPLLCGLAASPNFLKPNRDEALEAFGIDAREPHGKRTLLEKFAASGATHVFLTDGERPVAIYADGEFFLARPPEIRLVNPLGSGDAMVAAFIYGYLHGLSTPMLIAFTIAGGTVNAREFLPGFADLDQITTMAAQIEIEQLVD